MNARERRLHQQTLLLKKELEETKNASSAIKVLEAKLSSVETERNHLKKALEKSVHALNRIAFDNNGDDPEADTHIAVDGLWRCGLAALGMPDSGAVVDPTHPDFVRDACEIAVELGIDTVAVKRVLGVRA
jgi:hypothetical protein